MSALLLLAACGGRYERMRQQLDSLQVLNQSDSLLTDDSLALVLTQYFDRHGSPNERMQAHYLLARTYADMGQAPQALVEFHTAAECADTTSEECDYRLLGCVFSQMAWSYHQQLLLTYEMEARRSAEYYAKLAGDTLNFIYEKVGQAAVYILQNEKDSAEIVLKSALLLYNRYGYVKEGLHTSTMLMYLYKDNPEQQSELKRLIDKYDTECDLFDEHHELPSVRRKFYEYKGKYFEGIGRYDSAEYYYRKMYFPGVPYTIQDPMYRGLLSIFQKCHKSDSIAKYSLLYCAANDSSIMLKDQHLVAQMTAVYNYGRYQKKARENEQKAHHALISLLAVISGTAIAIMVGCLWFRSYRRRQQRERERLENEYNREEEKLQGKIKELQLLETAHKTVISQIQGELGAAQIQNDVIRLENKKFKRAIEIVNSQYENDKARLEMEIDILNSTIFELKQKLDFVENIDKAQKLEKTSLISRLNMLAENPRGEMSMNDRQELETLFGEYYPSLMQAMMNASKLTGLDKQVCLLTALDYDPIQIQRLLDMTPQQITNRKAKVNGILFQDCSASTLHENLIKRYSLYIEKKV